MGVETHRTIEITPLSVGCPTLQPSSLQAPSSSLLVTSLGLLIARARMVHAEDTLTLKSAKVLDTQVLEYCR